MNYRETHLSSGTRLDTDLHQSPTGIVGVNGHWGIRWERYEQEEHIAKLYGIPKSEIKSSGFDRIYQQDPEIERPEAIADELEAVRNVTQQVMELRGWSPDDIGGVVVGSGVPVADDPQSPDYAKQIIQMLGMPEQTITHTIYAACNSGPRAFPIAHTIPDLRGKPTLVMGIEGITTLTKDPSRADRFSFEIFSNGLAVTGIIPGVETDVFDHDHAIVPDKSGVIKATMTYDQLTEPVNDWNDPEQLWQKKNGIEMMLVRPPSEGKDIEMTPKATFVFFRRSVPPFVNQAIGKYIEAFPGKPIPHIISHHPSRLVFAGVEEAVARTFKEQGFEIEMPWLVPDGNSSAATGLIAFNRSLDERSTPGTEAFLLGFGIGASQDISRVVFKEGISGK